VAGPHSRHHDRSVPVAHGSRPLALKARGSFFYIPAPLRYAPAAAALGIVTRRAETTGSASAASIARPGPPPCPAAPAGERPHRRSAFRLVGNCGNNPLRDTRKAQVARMRCDGGVRYDKFVACP